METIDPQLRHDFINNSLRIEVLSKIICQNLEANTSPEIKHLEDFESFLNQEIELLLKLKESFL